MNVQELEAQLTELEAVYKSSKVDVKFDKATSSILATRTVHTPGRFGDIKIGSSGRASIGREGSTGTGSQEPNSSSTAEPGSVEKADVTSKESHRHAPTVGQETGDFESDWGTTRVERVAEINLADVEVPDEFIDERMRLAFDRRSAGELPAVKLVCFGASGVWEVVEDYSYAIPYSAIARRVPEAPRMFDDSGSNESSKHRVPHVAIVTAKRGFQFDRASIPRIFWVIISKDDLSNVPPLFHDLLYRYGGRLPNECVSPFTEFTRAEADYLFYHLMERSGVTSWRLQIAYRAVAQFSSFAWRKELSE